MIIPNRPSIITTVETDDQQAPVDPKDKETKGNIPLQSVENTIKSQRPTSTEETQVGNYASFIDSCCTPQVQQVCYEDPCCTPQVQQVCYEDSYCTPQVQRVCYDDSCCIPQTCASTCVSKFISS